MIVRLIFVLFYVNYFNIACGSSEDNQEYNEGPQYPSYSHYPQAGAFYYADDGQLFVNSDHYAGVVYYADDGQNYVNPDTYAGLVYYYYEQPYLQYDHYAGAGNYPDCFHSADGAVTVEELEAEMKRQHEKERKQKRFNSYNHADDVLKQSVVNSWDEAKMCPKHDHDKVIRLYTKLLEYFDNPYAANVLSSYRSKAQCYFTIARALREKGGDACDEAITYYDKALESIKNEPYKPGLEIQTHLDLSRFYSKKRDQENHLICLRNACAIHQKYMDDLVNGFDVSVEYFYYYLNEPTKQTDLQEWFKKASNYEEKIQQSPYIREKKKEQVGNRFKHIKQNLEKWEKNFLKSSKAS